MFCAIRCGSCRRVTHRRYVFDSSSANGTLTGSVWTQRTPLGVGPAPGTGSPTITSADYGFCGLEAISGYFDNLASARIQVAPSGYFELVTSQAAYARTAGFSPPTASARCRRLTDFTGLPPNSQATGKINQVSDTSLPFAPSTTSSVGAAPAHIWQGFTGPLSSGSGGTLASYRQGWADLGAFSSSSKGCFQPYSGALCATGSNQNLLVLASPYVGTTNTMTTFSYQAGYSPTRTWTCAATASNFCFIAGLYTGSPGGNSSAGFSVFLEEAIPPAPFPAIPQYRFRSTTTSQSKVYGWIECIPLAQ